MLVRITGDNPPFVAGVVFDEDGYVHRFAPIVKWANGLSADALRAELDRRGLKATLVRTLIKAEIEGE